MFTSQEIFDMKLERMNKQSSNNVRGQYESIFREDIAKFAPNEQSQFINLCRQLDNNWTRSIYNRLQDMRIYFILNKSTNKDNITMEEQKTIIDQLIASRQIMKEEKKQNIQQKRTNSASKKTAEKQVKKQLTEDNKGLTLKNKELSEQIKELTQQIKKEKAYLRELKKQEKIINKQNKVKKVRVQQSEQVLPTVLEIIPAPKMKKFQFDSEPIMFEYTEQESAPVQSTIIKRQTHEL